VTHFEKAGFFAKLKHARDAKRDATDGQSSQPLQDAAELAALEHVGPNGAPYHPWQCQADARLMSAFGAKVGKSLRAGNVSQ
jgi:hypothetical protein